MYRWRNVFVYSAIVIFLLALIITGTVSCNAETNTNAELLPAALSRPSGSLIINHKCTSLELVPSRWIERAKSDIGVYYGHTSHGGQIMTGMRNLESHEGDLYDFNKKVSGGALLLYDVSGDLGHNGDLAWEKTTRKQIEKSDNIYNLVVWSWCGGVSDNTKEGIDTYLNAMNRLEIDFPDIVFVYMTGHLDGTGDAGNLNIRNNQIREYCIENNKVLFDFADIESYNPDGEYFLDLNADDNCNYDDGNWAEEWCDEHPDSDLCWPCSCAHSQSLNCNLKSRAFWWMLARLAGWEGA